MKVVIHERGHAIGVLCAGEHKGAEAALKFDLPDRNQLDREAID